MSNISDSSGAVPRTHNLPALHPPLPAPSVPLKIDSPPMANNAGEHTIREVQPSTHNPIFFVLFFLFFLSSHGSSKSLSPSLRSLPISPSSLSFPRTFVSSREIAQYTYFRHVFMSETNRGFEEEPRRGRRCHKCFLMASLFIGDPSTLDASRLKDLDCLLWVQDFAASPPPPYASLPPTLPLLPSYVCRPPFSMPPLPSSYPSYPLPLA